MSNPKHWMQTYTRRPFRFDDMLNLDIDIRDISVPISRLSRFGGHAQGDIKVGEHCLVVSKLYEQKFPNDPLGKLHALLHDAHEYFGWGDMVAPFKRFLMAAYQFDVNALQAEMQVNILAALGVPMMDDLSKIEYIHHCDLIACCVERQEFMPSPLQWDIDHIDFDPNLRDLYLFLSPGEIEPLFRQQFTDLLEEIDAESPMASGS